MADDLEVDWLVETERRPEASSPESALGKAEAYSASI